MIVDYGSAWVKWYNHNHPVGVVAVAASPCYSNKPLIPKGKPAVELCNVWFKSTFNKKVYCSLVLTDVDSKKVIFQNPPAACPILPSRI